MGISFFVNTTERKKQRYSERTKRSVLQQGHGPGWCFTWKWKSTFPHLRTELASGGLGTQGCTGFSTKWLSFPKEIYQRRWGRTNKTAVAASPGKLPAPAACAERVWACVPASTGVSSGRYRGVANVFWASDILVWCRVYRAEVPVHRQSSPLPPQMQKEKLFKKVCTVGKGGSLTACVLSAAPKADSGPQRTTWWSIHPGRHVELSVDGDLCFVHSGENFAEKWNGLVLLLCFLIWCDISAQK